MNTGGRRGGGAGARLAMLSVAAMLASLSACRRALAIVFDVPPRPSAQYPVGADRSSVDRAAAGAATLPPATPPPDTARPEIERLTEPEAVRARLPRDRAGNIDWVRAVRDSIIRPRATLPGRVAVPEGGFQFAYDFWFQGPDTTFDARFPHSTHTEWIACQQCHPRIFPYRETTVKMADIFQGKYCGECHGKVAYPVMTGCERCHARMTMPANRAKPDFLGFVQMGRVKVDSGNAAGVEVDELPRATFPHWAHRMRYRCKACHVDVFEPRAGANRVTMQDIADGRACGVCHDGRTAFRAGFGTCDRCHLPAPGATPPTATPPAGAPAPPA